MVYLDETVIQQLIEAFNRRELEPVTKLTRMMWYSTIQGEIVSLVITRANWEC
jgi:hypothetical protein